LLRDAVAIATDISNDANSTKRFREDMLV